VVNDEHSDPDLRWWELEAQLLLDGGKCPVCPLQKKALMMRLPGREVFDLGDGVDNG
jgi:hypothetical protein